MSGTTSITGVDGRHPRHRPGPGPRVLRRPARLRGPPRRPLRRRPLDRGRRRGRRRPSPLSPPGSPPASVSPPRTPTPTTPDSGPGASTPTQRSCGSRARRPCSPCATRTATALSSSRASERRQRGSIMDKQFTAELRKSPNQGGWTYLVWPESVEFFGTRGWSRSGAPSTATPSEPRSWPWATAPTCSRSRPTSVRRSTRRGRHRASASRSGSTTDLGRPAQRAATGTPGSKTFSPSGAMLGSVGRRWPSGRGALWSGSATCRPPTIPLATRST